MRDYVIKISDIPPFHIALRAEVDAGSPYAYITEDDEVRHNLPITGVIPKAGNATVSICRLNQAQHDWITGLAGVSILGTGAPYIKDIDDVTWKTQGKGFYHAIHDQTPYDIDDGEGGTITVTPSLLHGVLWS